MSDSNKLVQALDLWVHLSAFDPEKQERIAGIGGDKSTPFSGWSMQKMNQDIKQAIELDDTLVTGFLLLKYVSQHYFRNASYTVDDLMNRRDDVQQFLEAVSDFQSLLADEDVGDEYTQYLEGLRAILAVSSIDSEDALRVLADEEKMAFLRRDALLTLQRLHGHQFLSGEFSDRSPAYNRILFQFWNMNSLLECMCRQPDGISMVLIRDPDEFFSHFAFVVKNSGNLVVYSDMSEDVHPLQRSMRRRPDREMNQRSIQDWFPYELLNVEFDEEQGRGFIKAAGTDLVPHQQEVFKFAEIGNLTGEQIVWFVMVVHLLAEKHWTRREQLPQLSYTAEMLYREDRLLSTAEASGLPVGVNDALELEPLTPSDILGASDQASFGSDGGGPNSWLEKRYGNRVSSRALNIFSAREEVLLLPGDDSENVVRCTEKEFEGLTRELRVSGEGVPGHQRQIGAVNPQWVGTREKIDQDRKYVARYNAAKEIQVMATAEYTARNQEMLAWVKDKYRKNAEQIVAYCSRHLTSNGVIISEATQDNLEFGHLNEEMFFGGKLRLHGRHQFSRRDDYKTCFFTNVAASVFMHLQVTDAKILSLLCGCSVDGLPELLQNYGSERQYVGNSILSRIDPMAWALDDPWTSLSLDLTINLSKRAFNRIRKEYPSCPVACEAIKQKRKRHAALMDSAFGGM